MKHHNCEDSSQEGGNGPCNTCRFAQVGTFVVEGSLCLLFLSLIKGSREIFYKPVLYRDLAII